MYLSFCTRGSDLYMYFSFCTRLCLTCTVHVLQLLYQARSDLYMYLSFCTRLGPVEYEVKALNHMLLVAAPDLPTVDRSIFCPVMFSIICSTF
jgi:hypothetical protein